MVGVRVGVELMVGDGVEIVAGVGLGVSVGTGVNDGDGVGLNPSRGAGGDSATDACEKGPGASTQPENKRENTTTKTTKNCHINKRNFSRDK
ncbi:MAG TPA: hypothetical protein ENL17_04170 [Candidatus Methanoperedenaceae archaeon]|nr:hypothetical protein [Candidatus Methanoperedenaceae archaeon]